MSNIKEHFKQILQLNDPKKILYQVHHALALKIGENIIRIAEAEYYPWSDSFCHKNEKQKETCTFYVHRFGHSSTNAYKAGTYKGLDITCQGGILIRSIIVEDKLIEGPCLCVDYILKITNWTLKDLEEKIELVEASFDDNYVLYGARKGITLKKVKDHNAYILRYRSSIVLLKKGIETFFVTNINREDIPRKQKYIDEFNQGKTKEINENSTQLEVAGRLSTL